jgi:hypothetical membrane protein
MRRLRSPWGGIAGPAVFIAAWLLGGAIEPGYSPVHEPISGLAAFGASVRPLMTTGLLGFGIGMLLYAGALRAALAGPAWKAALATSIATFGVAALPLGLTSATVDGNGAVAVVAYATLVAMPLLAVRSLAASERRGAATLSVAIGVVSGLCLAATVLGMAPGLLQRVGLTLVDAWVVGSAACMLRQDGRGEPP